VLNCCSLPRPLHGLVPMLRLVALLPRFVVLWACTHNVLRHTQCSVDHVAEGLQLKAVRERYRVRMLRSILQRHVNAVANPVSWRLDPIAVGDTTQQTYVFTAPLLLVLDALYNCRRCCCCCRLATFMLAIHLVCSNSCCHYWTCKAWRSRTVLHHRSMPVHHPVVICSRCERLLCADCVARNAFGPLDSLVSTPGPSLPMNTQGGDHVHSVRACCVVTCHIWCDTTTATF
jgi:hypothetical protein